MKTKRENGNRLVERAEELIKKCKNSDFEDVNAGWVAQELRVSLPHLSRTFKKARGISLHKFIDREKITRAETLLKRYPKIKIKTVAETLGYSSVSYFARIFMKYNNNISPLYYRLLSFLEHLKKRRSARTEANRSRREGNPALPETPHSVPKTIPGVTPAKENTIPSHNVTPPF